jgi:tetratricopeptide (TPR) repeat protein
MDNLQKDRSGDLMRYLDKEMEPADQLAFEAELKADEALYAEAGSLEGARTAVLLYGTTKQVSQIFAEERANAEMPVVQMPARRRILRYSIAAAASVILIFFAANLFNASRTSADGLYTEGFTRFEPSADRGTATEISPLEKTYVAKNDAALISLYTAESDPAPKDMLMAGIGYLETNRAPAAIEIFKSLLAKNTAAHTVSFNDEAVYYLALAYLKNKNYSNAVELMEKINADKENPYSIKFPRPYIDRIKKL